MASLVVKAQTRRLQAACGGSFAALPAVAGFSERGSKACTGIAQAQIAGSFCLRAEDVR